jgi:thiol-disulfide isomerase/thioredoxin
MDSRRSAVANVDHGVPMRRFVVIAIASMLTASMAYAVEEGELAPRWNGIGFDGASVEFPALLDGKPAVVVFWATWCPYCKAFMPYLERIQAEYGTESISIVMIDVMEDGEGDPAAYIDALGFPLIAVRDGDAIAAAYDVLYTPGLLVVDAEGLVAFKRATTQLPAGSAVSSLWYNQIRATLRGLLGE